MLGLEGHHRIAWTFGDNCSERAPSARSGPTVRLSSGIIDARLPDMDGLQLASKMAQQHTMTKIILISGYYSEEDLSIVDAIQAMRVHGFSSQAISAGGD